jgi:hypothetical protein
MDLRALQAAEKFMFCIRAASLVGPQANATHEGISP